MLVAFALTTALSFSPQLAGSAAEAPIALVETFADGVTTFEIVTSKPAWRWTPKFPRVENFKPRESDPILHALKISRELVGRDVRVTVSLLVRAPQDEIPVSELMVSFGSTVVVNELMKFGVAPVTLSLARVAPLQPYPPIVVTSSPELEVSEIETRSAPYPGYRVTLRNLSSKAISNVHFQSYRGGEKALSGLPRGQMGRPLLSPGGSYVLDINLTSGGGDPLIPSSTWSPRPLDVIEFDSIRWDDATHTGNPPYPQVEAVIEADGGARLQLTRVIDALRDALKGPVSGSELIAQLKARITALADAEPAQLPNAQAAMLSIKVAVLGDIRRFEAGAKGDTASVRKWLAVTLQRYETWLSRLAA